MDNDYTEAQPSRAEVDSLPGPTLVMLDGGKEVARVVRPVEEGEIGKALEKIDPVQ
jgi:hypothetical protein